MNRFSFALVLATLIIALPVAAQNAPTANIYGIHGWGGDANTLMNGKGMYSVDMIYSDKWASDAAYRTSFTNQMASAYGQGFTLIIRIDYASCQVVPPEYNWDLRWEFGERCKSIASTLKPYCRIWVIGNEMQAPYCPYQPTKEWYTTVFAGDGNGCYDKIHSVQSDAIVCFGGLGGWPGENPADPSTGLGYMDYFCKNCGGKVDGFAVHSYNGPANNTKGGTLDDPRSSDIGSFGAYKAFCKQVYSNFQTSKKIYITEWNTYWWISHNAPMSDQSYEAGNIQNAYQAIDQWNRSNDLKVSSMCWYAFSHYGSCPPAVGDFYYNAIQAGRCTAAPKLDQARNDFSWTTANTNYRSDVNSDGRLQIEAENYDNDVIWGDTAGTGWEGNDFHDTDSGNNGTSYRPDAVDIGPGGTGFMVGWTANGEWLKYTMLGGRVGQYKLEMRYARAAGSGTSTIRVTVDNANVATFTVSDTGGWNTWATATSSAFSMSSGAHTVKLIFDVGSVNVDWFAFTPAATPSAPSNLAATAVSASQINLTWTDNSGIETNNVVMRSTTSGGPYTTIATLGANVTSYSNTGLSANTTYYYVVKATNANGSSPNSNQASALTWPAEVVVDNANAGFSASANWLTGTSAADKYGASYRYRSMNTVTDYGTFTYSVPQSRNYEVYAWWSQGTNRTMSAPFVISKSGGTSTVYRNQRANGGSWQSLGTYSIVAGSNTVKLSCWSSTTSVVIMADAIRVVPR